MDAYRRCLLSGPQYDLQVAYRLCQLWLDLQSHPPANEHFFTIFSEVPSHKFVPLTYQLASRISAVPDDAGFQQVLQGMMLILARHHPHHTLTHLLALKHGNLNAEGKSSRVDKYRLYEAGWDQVSGG